MENTQLTHFESVLNQRKQAILTQLNENAKTLQGLQNSEPIDSVDFSSVATSSQIERTIALSLRQELEDVEHSLAKFRQKIYGICELCGDEIDRERLKIKPQARYCKNCREIIEKERQ